MVQLEKVDGQKGHMIIHEDGSVISSSGELSSSESTAQSIINLMSHSMLINSNTGSTPSPHTSESGDGQHAINGVITDQPTTTTTTATTNNIITNTINGHDTSANPVGQPWKWNRMTIDFEEHSYVACLSNKRIHVVKRDHVVNSPEAEAELTSSLNN